jgi:hypothetical protein
MNSIRLKFHTVDIIINYVEKICQRDDVFMILALSQLAGFHLNSVLTGNNGANYESQERIRLIHRGVATAISPRSILNPLT